MAELKGLVASIQEGIESRISAKKFGGTKAYSSIQEGIESYVHGRIVEAGGASIQEGIERHQVLDEAVACLEQVSRKELRDQQQERHSESMYVASIQEGIERSSRPLGSC